MTKVGDVAWATSHALDRLEVGLLSCMGATQLPGEALPRLEQGYYGLLMRTAAYKRSVFTLGATLLIPVSAQARNYNEPEAERECLVQATFENEADFRYAEELAIEAIDESPRLAPTLHIRCSRLDEIARFATSYDVVDSDMQATFAAEKERMRNWNARYSTRATSRAHRYNEYLNLEQLRAVVDDWKTEFPKYVDIEEFGRSVKDRPIRAVHISRFKGDDEPKYRMIILGGHHSREWLAHATTMCITERFIRGIDKKDSRYQKLLSHMVLTVIPMANPDGFVMSHNGKRMNRKNARGVDLNRNWDIAWGTGSEGQAGPGAQNYPGTGPWSEPESAAYRDFITKYSEGLKGFIDIHAFIPAIMSPYGYKRGKHPKAAEYRKIMDKMAAAMTGPGMKKYKTGPIHQVVYTASGSSADWVDDKFGAFSFGTEVRGRSFSEPASQIKPSCDENEAAILAFLEEIIPMDGDIPDPDESDSEGKDSDGEDTESENGNTGDGTDSSGEDSQGKDSEGSKDDSKGKKKDGSEKDNTKKKEDEPGTKKDKPAESSKAKDQDPDDEDKGGCATTGGTGSPLLWLGALLAFRRRRTCRTSRE